MGQLVVTECKKRQDTGYRIHVGSKAMSTMHIRRNRGIVEKEVVNGIRLVSLSGMKFYPISLALARRLCCADSSAYFQSQTREEENQARLLVKEELTLARSLFGSFQENSTKEWFFGFKN